MSKVDRTADESLKGIKKAVFSKYRRQGRVLHFQHSHTLNKHTHTPNDFPSSLVDINEFFKFTDDSKI